VEDAERKCYLATRKKGGTGHWKIGGRKGKKSSVFISEESTFLIGGKKNRKERGRRRANRGGEASRRKQRKVEGDPDIEGSLGS